MGAYNREGVSASSAGGRPAAATVPPVTLVLGLDPGLSGAWAILRCSPGCELPDYLSSDRLPITDDKRLDAAWLLRTLQQHGRIGLAAVEDVGAAPGQGLASTFMFGRATGAAEAVLRCLEVDEHMTMPASRWKASYGLPGGRAGKAESIRMAERLLGIRLPEAEAEASLIAWFGWLKRERACV
jgi:crossover junction endodeoxyribonuclease RuvC